jgi:hypothetical protein
MESYQINDWKSCCKLLIVRSARVMAMGERALIPYLLCLYRIRRGDSHPTVRRKSSKARALLISLWGVLGAKRMYSS